MIAEYKNKFYYSHVNDEQIVTLVTNDLLKKIDGFESKRDYFWKCVPLDDPELTTMYEIHFWVKYHDNIEENELWLVDEGRAVGAVPNIEEEKVVIDVNHDSREASWKQYDKGAASKTISLSNCEEFIIEKIYIKKDGSKYNNVEKTSVSLEDFRKAMFIYHQIRDV